ERAADLRGDAEGAAVRLRDEDHLERLRGIRPQHPLAGTVGGLLRSDDLRSLDACALGEPGAEVLGEIGHRLERGLAALVHPVHELAGAEGLAAELRHERLERGARQPQQIRRGRVGSGHDKASAASAARMQLRRAEEIGDFTGSRFRRIRAVDHVLLDTQGEVGADGAGSGLLRVGGAHDLAVAGNGIVALEHLHDDRSGGHVAHQILEKGALPVNGIEALGLPLGETDHAGGNDGEARLLEAAIDLADEIAADAVGLDDGQGALERHSGVLSGYGSDSPTVYPLGDPGRYTLKLSPQPHSPLTLGLRKRNASLRPCLTKSTVVPSISARLEGSTQTLTPRSSNTRSLALISSA